MPHHDVPSTTADLLARALAWARERHGANVELRGVRLQRAPVAAESRVVPVGRDWWRVQVRQAGAWTTVVSGRAVVGTAALAESEPIDPMALDRALRAAAPTDSNGEPVPAVIERLRSLPGGDARLEGVEWADAQVLDDARKSFDLVWIPSGAHEATCTLGAPEDLRPALEARCAVLREDPRHGAYHRDFEPKLDDLCTLYLRAALDRLGGRAVDGAQTRFVARLRRWVDHAGDRHIEDSAEALAQRLWDEYPEFRLELGLVRQCGPALGDVLIGDVDPLLVLFAEETWRTMTAFLRVGYSQAVYNELAAVAVRGLVSRGAPLRVLELGAGTGGLTAAVLDVFPPLHTEYVFTDVSRVFLTRAREVFARAPFVKYGLLDIEGDCAAQGFADASFDLVVAANVLHATTHVQRSVEQALRLVAPGGVLALVEITRPPIWLDLVFGLAEGWWKHADPEWRTDHATLPVSGWERLLRQCGCDQVVAVSHVTDPAASGQHVVLARRPHAPARQPASKVQRAEIWSADVHEPAEVFARAFAPLRDLAAARAGEPLVVVTRGAHRVAPHDRVSPAQAAIWGFARVLAHEHPTARLRLVDIGEGDAVDAALQAAQGESECAVRDSRCWLPRLVRTTHEGPPSVVRDASTYVVTGGTRGVGLAIAEHLVERGARHLVLLSRSGASPGESAAAIATLRAENVLVISADVADYQAVHAALARARASLPPVRGVIHAAMELRHERAAALDAAGFDRVWGAKALGALHLHEATREDALDFFVVLSSIAPILGLPGQASYSAANAFAEALVAQRQIDGLPGSALAFGMVGGTGYVARRPWLEEALVEQGGRAVPIAQVLRAFDRVLAAQPSYRLCADAEWSSLAESSPGLAARLSWITAP